MVRAKGNAGKVTDSRWHNFRERARREAFSPEEFSDSDRVRYNLDDDARISSANITGQNNPASYNGSDASGLDPLPTTDPDSDPIR